MRVAGFFSAFTGKTYPDIIRFSSIIIIACSFTAYSQVLPAEEIFNLVSPSVVTMLTYNGNEMVAQGSGVVINDSGWVVTNYHVFAGGDRLMLKQRDTIIDSISVIGVSIEKDLLLLKPYLPHENTIGAAHDYKKSPLNGTDSCLLNPYSKTWQSMDFISSDSLRVGQTVYAVGSPLGLENTISEGMVSGLRIYDAEGGGGGNWIQTTCPISPGSSGGALVDARGRLAGICTMTMKKGQNINLAVPSDDIFSVTIEDFTDMNKLEIFNYLSTGKSLYDVGQTDKAAECYRKVILRDSLNGRALYMTGRICYEKGKYPAAKGYFVRAIHSDPENVVYLTNLGYAHYQAGDLDSALMSYERVTAIDSHYAWVYNSIGLIYEMKNEFNKAEKAYLRAVKEDPSFFRAYNNLGQTYFRMKEYDKAEAVYKKAISLNIDYALGYSNLAAVYQVKKEYEQEIKILEKAMEKGLQGESIHLRMGHALFMMGIYEEAKFHLEKIPEHEKVALATIGKEAYEKSLASSYYFLARIAEKEGNRGKSKKLLKETYELRPDWKGKTVNEMEEEDL